MAKTLFEIKKELYKQKDMLRRKYPIKSLGVFGSYARGEQKSSSDIDILVEFTRPIGLLRFISLEQELERLLGVKVDLVTRKALKPGIGKRILKEVIKI